ncbi:MAG: hypothetical protein FWD18_09165 [Micrococcales bacterium]|nr:hypothetical protein [Micrococcales bacterium]
MTENPEAWSNVDRAYDALANLKRVTAELRATAEEHAAKSGPRRPGDPGSTDPTWAILAMAEELATRSQWQLMMDAETLISASDTEGRPPPDHAGPTDPEGPQA